LYGTPGRCVECPELEQTSSTDRQAHKQSTKSRYRFTEAENYLCQGRVVRMMMLVDRVIISTIVCTQKRPASQVAVIFVTRVKDVAVKVQCITSHAQTSTPL